MSEVTVRLMDLPPPGQRPSVPGLQVGQLVTGHAGRRLRVVKTDEWVISGDQLDATGPYATLQAQDDDQVRVIWPRAWYAAAGDQMHLQLEAA